jgi:hypothetical protein
MMLRPRTAPASLACWLVMVFLLAFCASHEQGAVPDIATDRAVIAAALADFVQNNSRLLGRTPGTILLDPMSQANPETTAEDVRAYAPEITVALSADLVDSFVERNRSPASIAPMISGSEWASLRGGEKPTWDLSPGVKISGALTLPGYSADGSRALLQFLHSWSIHTAIETYVLHRKNGVWTVEAKDQLVFL